MPSLLAAWRVSLQRMRSDWPIVAAAWLITLLAATLLAAGPIYSDAVSLAGIRRVLIDAPTTTANVEVSALLPPGQVAVAGDAVRRELDHALSGLEPRIDRSARSETFALPGQPSDEVRDLALLGFADGVERHAHLVAGAWPSASDGGAIDVAVLDAVADELGWAVGQELLLASRRDESRTLRIRIAGIYAVPDPGDPFWWNDPQATEGLTESDRYRTFGPLLTTPQALLSGASATDVRVTWRAHPDFARLDVEGMPALRARVAELSERLERVLAGGFPRASTGLHELLLAGERSLLVSRTGVLLLLVQLAVLAAYAIVLTAGLLADHRRADTALLRSRGAGPLQVGWMALVEALVLAAPAAVAAPFLAGAALRVLNAVGPLASIELGIDPEVSTLAFQIAAAAALAAALLLVVPPFLAARRFVDEQGGRSRFETRTIGQRLGLDLALLAVTLLGFWQLRLYGAPLTRSVQGTLGLDPLLVAAPALGLLAGGVLALRVIPLLAGLADALTRRGRHMVGALGAQQVARRPLRYTRAALLLMLAVAMGVFAISYADSWRLSQDDQAAFQVGADVRVETPGGGTASPGWALAEGLAAQPGVERLTPLERRTVQLPGAGNAELLALDAGAAGRIVALRADLAAGPLAELLRPLADGRPEPALLALEGEPRRLRVEAEVQLTEVSVLEFDALAGEWTYEPAQAGYLDQASVVGAEVVVRDARGITQRFTGDAVPLGNGRQLVEVALSARTPRAERIVTQLGGGFEEPIQILGVDLTVRLPDGARATAGQVRLAALATSDEEAGETWRRLDLDEAGRWSLFLLRSGGPRVALPRAEATDRTLVLGSAGPTGQITAPDLGARPPAVSYVPSGVVELANAPMPVLVNPGFAAGTATRTGDVVAVRMDNVTRQLSVAGALRSFPTTDPGRPLIVTDLSTLELLRFASSGGSASIDEWWLTTALGREADAAAAIAGALPNGRVTTLPERARSLSSDPVALGIVGALSLGFVVAGLFAIIGLAVSAAVSARQRRTEFALLRALGLSSRQLSAWLWLENAGLALVSLVAGTLLGVLIGWVALPYVTVTQQAAAPFPPPVVRMPWTGIAILVAASGGALALTVLALGSILRRFGIGSVLRMGED